jgi:hypothetical protein
MLSLLPLLALQACITSQDMLLRSSSRLPLPLGTIHVLPQDSGMILQGSLAVSEQSDKNLPVGMSLNNSIFGNNTGNTSQALGPSSISTPSTQISTQVSLLLNQHVRFGLGIEGTLEHAASWIEVGLRGGREISIEGFWAVGAVPVHSNTLWQTKTYDPQYSSYSGSYVGTDTTITTHTIDTSASQGFYRFGVHISRRKGGGPWLEAQMASIALLPATPTTVDQWGTTLTFLGLGWSEPTHLGTATAYARTVISKGNVQPIFGAQWTSEIKLGN